MANKRITNAKRRHKRRLKKLIWAVVILLVVGVAGYLCAHFVFDGTPMAKIEPVSGKEVQIHFIDVGQGDAILIRTTSGDVLIDSGDNGMEDELMAYLNKYGVDDLEYVVFTHPDADHIGGSDAVLENYEVKHVLRPNRDSGSKTFQTMEALIEEEGCPDTIAKVEDEFRVGEVKFTILAPIGKSYENNNDASVVLRMDYGETSVLLTGDAELNSEEEMLKRFGSATGGLLDCDILKVGHHGSDSSTGEDFLEAVTPDFAIISCGEGNKYNHPHASTIDRLEDMKISTLRTDLEGSIAFTTDGETIERIAA